MGVLILALVIVIIVITLGELNPMLINLNLYGLVIKNVPFSIIITIFLVIGCFLGVATMLAKYNYMKKQYKDLKALYDSEKKELEEDDS